MKVLISVLKSLLLVTLSIWFVRCSSEDEPRFEELSTEPGNIETIAGMGPDHFGYEGDGGLATTAKIGWITGVSVDEEGNIYLTDGAANTVRKIDRSNGQINTHAGSFRGYNIADQTPFAGDGGPATDAHLNVPMAVAADYLGEVFIVDAGNHLIRKVQDEKISTIAGVGGSIGYSGDGNVATSAMLFNPGGVALDAEGNIYIADTQNNVIRKVTIGTGIISTIAGQGPDNPGYTGDGGPAVAAKLNTPFGVAIDKEGALYFSDSGNNVIRKITNGVITTIAGTGVAGYSGDGGPATSATLFTIKGLAVDNEGNVFVADAGNSVIRKIASTGIITTYAGNGSAGFSGDGGLATSAQLNNPWGVATDQDGNVYVADTDNSAIRFIAR